MKLSVAAGNEAFGRALAESLSRYGHNTCYEVGSSNLLGSHRRYDAAILDLELTGGVDLLRNLRMVSNMPVVALGASEDERSIIRALRCGADDYMVKPPGVRELIARLEAIARRVPPPRPAPSQVTAGDVRIDLDERTVEAGGVPVDITRKEFELIRVLAERQGCPVSREQLTDHLWSDAARPASRTLDVHLNAVRNKLNRPGLITTVRGYGFRLSH
ncbi:response regulator transcription factor [Nocardia sp. NPDC127579]|uniref:response regulator transcription factor n=1 Tax=Nocardia sp. NPDC127579 TaxID=3345402 RepID=UPI003638B224